MSGNSFCNLFCGEFKLANQNSINVLNCTSSPVTSSYVTIVASTSIVVSELLCSDTTGALLKLAVGPVAQEVDIFQLPVNSIALIPLASTATIPVGSRLSVKAIDAGATTGYCVVTLPL